MIQLAAEIKELNQELKNYDERNAAMEDNIAATERKKTRVLNVLNSNRARYTSVVKDSKKSK
jgi:chromosome segregation ATPase